MPVSQPLMRALVLNFLVIYLAACSSGSEESTENAFGDEIIHGSGPDAGNRTFDVTPPSANIFFPPPSALTGANTITVTGSAADVTGISSIVVNGVRASSDNGFLTWRARVPLSSGANILQVTSTDTLGNRDSAAAATTVVNNAVFTAPFGIALDSANNQLVLIDSSLAAVVTVNLLNGQRDIISSATEGEGPALVEPGSLIVDDANGRAIVVDGMLAALVAVDLATGNRTILSNTTMGSGEDFVSPSQIALDTTRNRVLVTDPVVSGVYAVDLITGDRSILSDDNNGSGPGLDFPDSIAVDAGNNRALVIDLTFNSVIAVDLVSGDRSVLSSNTIGAGPDLIAPGGISVDPGAGQIIVTDVGLVALVDVDPVSGSRTSFSSAGQGAGPEFVFPLALVSNAGQSFVVDTGLASVLQVDSSNGDRAPLSEAGIGIGPRLEEPFSIAVNRANNAVLVIDRTTGELYGVSINTGERTIVSGAGVGDGPLMLFPTSVVLQSTTGNALVVDAAVARLAVTRIDLASGDRTIVSDPNNGSGEPLRLPTSSAYDATNNRLFITDPDPNGTDDVIRSVDIGSGNRTIVSGRDIGSGPSFDFPESITFDSANQISYVTDTTQDRLLAVNINTGDRSQSAIGSGTPFPLITQASRPPDRAPRQGVTLTPDEVIVVDSLQRSVYGFNTTSGARRIVSSAEIGVGTDLQSPIGMAFDPATGTLFLIDRVLSAVLAIEPVSGDRVIVSR